MLVNTTYRMQEMSRDAYMDIGGTVTGSNRYDPRDGGGRTASGTAIEDAKAEDRAALSHPCDCGISTSMCVSP